MRTSARDQYLGKGSLIFIEVKIQTPKWEDRGGSRWRTTDIVAGEMRMIEVKKPTNGNGRHQQREDYFGGGLSDDDIFLVVVNKRGDP